MKVEMAIATPSRVVFRVFMIVVDNWQNFKDGKERRDLHKMCLWITVALIEVGDVAELNGQRSRLIYEKTGASLSTPQLCIFRKCSAETNLVACIVKCKSISRL